jgi:hypothetical protein
MIQYPCWGPWAKNPDNYLWIDITVLEIDRQSTLPRNSVDKSIPVRQEGTVFRLLAPSDVIFSLGHRWSDYENITSRLANVISSWMVPTTDAGGVIGNLWSQAKTLITGKDLAKGGVDISQAIQNMVGVDVQQYRVDTPLVYKSSEPIQYVFPFEFAIYGQGKSQGPDIYDITNRLLRFSCPKRKDNSFLEIKPPNIFSICTYPETNMFKIQRAAITSITTNMKEHYHHGYPSVMQTQVTFQDITPLFEDKFATDTNKLPLVTGTVTGGSEGL